MNFKKIFTKYKTIFSNAASWFGEDKAMKMSASLSYSTIFSLGPMLFLVVFIAGNLYSQEAIEGRVYMELKDWLGAGIAEVVQNLIIGLNKNSSGTIIARTISIITLIMGATGVFTEIQDSLNQIWGVKAKPKKGLIRMLISRLLSFSMIISLGFILIVSLVVNTIIIGLSTQFFDLLQFNRLLPEISKGVMTLISNALVFVVLTMLFSIIFKVLPDVKLKFKQVLPGAMLTTLLFMIGKFAIGAFVEGNKMASLYGAASSVIILLLWVYYSAAILYFGAEFTRAYIEFKGAKIEPSKYAIYDEKRILLEFEKQLKSGVKEGGLPELAERTQNKEPVLNIQNRKVSYGELVAFLDAMKQDENVEDEENTIDKAKDKMS